MKIAQRVILTLLALALVGCGGSFSRENIDITSDYEPDPGFQNYKTWDYASYVGLGPFSADRAMRDRLDARVQEALAKRGLEYKPGNPDLRVGYFLAAQKVDAGEVSDYYVEFTPQFDQQLKSLDKGSLSVFIFDSKTGEMVWRATADAELDKGASLDQRKERFETVVGWLLEELP
jgi:hypothetical protein